MKLFLKKYKFYIGVFVLLGVFIAIFTLNTSDSKTAITEIRKASSEEMVLESWNKWEGLISSSNGQEKLIKATKDKLATMDLSDEQIQKWHSRFKNMSNYSVEPSLNIIVVPDLSNRINQIPNTIEYDKEIISEIYRMFFNKAKIYNSTDKLVLEVTDKEQAQGSFGKIAQNLSIDMIDKENNTNAKKYLEGKEEVFKDNLAQLYDRALEQTSGADYLYYFKRILPNRIKKSDIHNEYKNKIIILTDGYLETKDKIYTQTSGSIEQVIKKAVLQGNLSEVMDYNNLKIPPIGYKLPNNTDVLVLEVVERPNGTLWHKEVLQEYWKDWFIDMGVKIKEGNDDFFRLHNDNVDETKKIIKRFLSN